ncbi:mucoidy inhibitor MuiA family protein [Kordiimonas laminariae]|uniref:mucoidy inhibitor MuiA family protein n=1 Tax=Kordiimonas laminariae TaxID=2917717 RepID=UPI001FF66209|nr:mucoidy inhibitor MuiA family protein [Kordiimonas laminariae]MCK0069825.1 mucoidy inhibitor MuiA family protein [Kordiimonas laminariae]
MKKYLLSTLLISSSLTSSALFADDYTADHKVDTATVYRNGGALVGRKATFTVEAGLHTITFPRLPKNADKEFSPFINILKGKAEITSVKFQEVYASEITSDAQRNIQEQIDFLQKQAAEEQRSIESKELQMNFLRTLGNNGGQQTANLSVNDWQNAFNFIGEKGDKLLGEIATSRLKINDLSSEINALYRKLQEAGDRQDDTITGVVTLETKEAQTLELALNYFMENAKWKLDVSSLLDTEAEQITITDKASISQKTGENWTNIALTLSNNYQFGRFGSINQRPEFLSFLELERLKASAPRQEFGLVQADSAEAIAITGSRRISSSNSTFNRSYNISGAYSLESSADSSELIISSNKTDANTVIRALPRVDKTAYVFAQAQFNNLETQRNIEASLYRDGHFIGKDRWPDLISGELLNLPFGVDNLVDISYTLQAPQNGEKGVFTKSNIEEKRVLISVKNQHSTEQVIEIFDRIPVSSHKDIKVTSIKGATKPTEVNMDNKQGLLMWRKTLKPGETWEIKHQYRITYPSDQRLLRR